MEIKVIEPLTREQLEYIKLKQSFEKMSDKWGEYREKVPCCDLSNRHKNSNFTIEDVFYNLLENHSKKTIK